MPSEPIVQAHGVPPLASWRLASATASILAPAIAHLLLLAPVFDPLQEIGALRPARRAVDMVDTLTPGGRVRKRQFLRCHALACADHVIARHAVQRKGHGMEALPGSIRTSGPSLEELEDFQGCPFIASGSTAVSLSRDACTRNQVMLSRWGTCSGISSPKSADFVTAPPVASARVSSPCQPHRSPGSIRRSTAIHPMAMHA